MTKVVIWCRHSGDSIIGSGTELLWHIPSDLRRFKALTEGETVVTGRKTYESFPNRTLPNRRILVVTQDKKYQVSDIQNHLPINDLSVLADYPENLYIAGGAAVYKAFFDKNELLPDVVVDCVYTGEITADSPTVNVADCVEVLNEKYWRLPQTYELDKVQTSVWLKKGEFVEQAVVKKIVKYLETEGK